MCETSALRGWPPESCSVMPQESLHLPANQWHGERVTELRACRRQLGQSQAKLAAMLGVALNSLRMWDSGMRTTPTAVLEQAKTAAAEAVRCRNSRQSCTCMSAHCRQQLGPDGSKYNTQRARYLADRSESQPARQENCFCERTTSDTAGNLLDASPCRPPFPRTATAESVICGTTCDSHRRIWQS